MGDRASIVIKEAGESVALYSHWTGKAVLEDLRAGLVFAREKRRLDDAPYLARIIFCRMVPQSEWYEPTGFGISQTPPGDSRDVVVDVDNQTVWSDRNDFNIPLCSIDAFILSDFEESDDEEESEDEG